jgi:CRP/FNR family transcriptional regulator, nitrogen oxide reductase regulator
MPQTRALSQTASLPLRQSSRLEVKAGASRWRHGAELSQLFSAIPPDDVAVILAAAHSATFARRQTIFFAGEKTQRVVLLMEGSVKITQIDESGSTVILRLAGPGEVVGELGGGRLGTHMTAAEARVPCKALVWEWQAFESLSERFPALQRNTMRILAKSLRDLEARFCEVATKRVAQRLALELTRLLPQVGRKVGEEIEINLSREELAQMTATTLFTVSRQLSLWEEQGILTLRRLGVVIRNPLSLITVSELK